MLRSQRCAPAALPPRLKRGTHFTGGWVGTRAGLDGCGKSRPPPGIRYPDRPACSVSLYRLSYPGSSHCSSIFKIIVRSRKMRGKLGLTVSVTRWRQSGDKHVVLWRGLQLRKQTRQHHLPPSWHRQGPLWDGGSVWLPRCHHQNKTSPVGITVTSPAALFGCGSYGGHSETYLKSSCVS